MLHTHTHLNTLKPPSGFHLLAGYHGNRLRGPIHPFYSHSSSSCRRIRSPPPSSGVLSSPSLSHTHTHAISHSGQTRGILLKTDARRHPGLVAAQCFSSLHPSKHLSAVRKGQRASRRKKTWNSSWFSSQTSKLL